MKVSIIGIGIQSEFCGAETGTGCRFVQTLDFDRKVPPFALFETSFEGGHPGEVVSQKCSKRYTHGLLR
jgi:hypothetical protein